MAATNESLGLGILNLIWRKVTKILKYLYNNVQTKRIVNIVMLIKKNYPSIFLPDSVGLTNIR